jgi:hypothetical protein
MPDQLGYRDYLQRAFTRKVHIPLLGSMPVVQLGLAAFAALGIANPGFWALGGALGGIFVFLRASSARFQKLIQGEMLLQAQESWSEKLHHAVGRLRPDSQERYRKLLGQCRRILGISATLENDSLGSFRDMRGRSLNQLLWIFLRLLTSREVIQANIRDADRSRLERDVVRLEQRLAEANPASPLGRSLHGTLEIQRRRLENLGRAGESLAVIEAELERIEQQAELIREEAAVTGKPEDLSMRLDAVTSTMSETSRWMDEHASFFDSLTGDPGFNPVAELPSMPPEVEEETEEAEVVLPPERVSE